MLLECLDGVHVVLALLGELLEFEVMGSLEVVVLLVAQLELLLEGGDFCEEGLELGVEVGVGLVLVRLDVGDDLLGVRRGKGVPGPCARASSGRVCWPLG